MNHQPAPTGSEGQHDHAASPSPKSGYPEIGIGLGLGAGLGTMTGLQFAGTGGIGAAPWLELGIGVGVPSGVMLGLLLGRALRQSPLPWEVGGKLLARAWLAGAFMVALGVGAAVGEAAGGAGGRWLGHGIVAAGAVVMGLVIGRARAH